MANVFTKFDLILNEVTLVSWYGVKNLILEISIILYSFCFCH